MTLMPIADFTPSQRILTHIPHAFIRNHLVLHTCRTVSTCCETYNAHICDSIEQAADQTKGRMLLTPRTYSLAQTPDAGCTEARSSYFLLTPSRKELLAEEQRARRMLLLHQNGSVKVGQVIR